MSGQTKSQGGVAIVEFSLLAPIAFVLLLGLLVLGLLVANQNLLTDAVRDTARAAAVCGGFNRDQNTKFSAPTGSATPTACGADAASSWTSLSKYANARLSFLAGAGALTAPAATTTNCQQLPPPSGVVKIALVCLFDKNDAPVATSNNPFWDCQPGYKIEISSQAAQPLYMPLLGHIFGNGGSNTRTLSADAEAVCEQ
jgi:hypothetical protein